MYWGGHGGSGGRENRLPRRRGAAYLDLQSVADGERRVLQRLDDGGVGVGELGVLPHQSDGALLQQTVRPAHTPAPPQGSKVSDGKGAEPETHLSDISFHLVSILRGRASMGMLSRRLR